MRLLRKLPEDRRKFLRELVTFGLVGGVNTIFGFVVFNLLFTMGSLTANAISTAAATVISFILNRHITYRDRMRTPLRREVPLFAAFNLVGLGIQQAVMALAKAGFDLHETARLEFNLVRIVSTGLGTLFLLLSYRTIVFKRQPVQPPGVAAPVRAPITAMGSAVAIESALDTLEFPRIVDEPAGAEPTPAMGEAVTAEFARVDDDAFDDVVTDELALDEILDGAVRSAL